MNITSILKDARGEFLGKIITDDILLQCFSVDASPFGYIPKIIFFAECENDIKCLINLANKYNFSITFKASGTSLSGQAQSDEVVCFVKCFDEIEIDKFANYIKLGASVIGARANEELRKYGKKIGPDPATIGAASIGGIVANNSSGMCCGVKQNSYQCIKNIRVLLSDGFLLDTSDENCIKEFYKTHKKLIQDIENLKNEIRDDIALKQLISNKFKIKNTTGYSLNSFIDFDETIEILKHLLVGSEGTLGCILKVELECVQDYKFYASALLIYQDYKSACEVIMALAEHKDIILSAEFMDYPSTKSVFGLKGVSDDIKIVKPKNGLILLKTGANNQKELDENIAVILKTISPFKNKAVLEKFSQDESEIASWWAARSGLLPIVAGARNKGTAVITEDFCFKIKDLAQGIVALSDIISKHGFDDCGAIAGHALEGNLHFILTPNLNDEEVCKRFYALLDDCVNTITAYQGSLKAEHGTGRIIAPFVVKEWGQKAYEIMRKIKKIFDPKGIFNKDVIICDDENIHQKNLKKRSIIQGEWDSCIECGFCEKYCPSWNSDSLSPRHRIVFKKLLGQENIFDDKDDNLNKKQLKFSKKTQKIWEKYGIKDCATCHMCASLCPIGLDVGKMIQNEKTKDDSIIARAFLNHQSFVISSAKIGLITANAMPKISKWTSQKMHKILGTPVTRDFLPSANDFVVKNTIQIMQNHQSDDWILYFSTCINRGFAPNKKMKYQNNIQKTIENLCQKSKINLKYVKNLKNLCCGKAYVDFAKLHDENLQKIKQALKESIEEIFQINQNAQIKILLDHGACSSHLKECLGKTFLNCDIFDSIEFANYLLGHLKIIKKRGIYGAYAMCATKKLGLLPILKNIVESCTDGVVVDENTACCGFAGYKGFFNPNLNINALRKFKRFYEKQNIIMGFSNSSTCEIGLSEQSGKSWQNILCLVDDCSV